MRKFFLCLLVLPTLVFWCFHQPAFASDVFDIAKTPWGTTRKQTAKALNIKLPSAVPPDGGMSVSGFELDGFDGHMGYVFLDDKLIEINFSITAEKQKGFTEQAAGKLKERLERQFTRHYGDPEINGQQCDNIEDCVYSLWHKDTMTAVGLFYVNGKQLRNLGISYMQRKAGGSTSPFYQPNKGLVIVPPSEEPAHTPLLR